MSAKRVVTCAVMAVIGIVTGHAVLTTKQLTQPTGAVVIEQQPQGTLRTSPKGLAMIGNAEGCRRDPYRCPAGMVTNGIGNTHHVPNHTVTLNDVARDWVRNLRTAEQCVSEVEQLAGRPMSQGQFDALTSLVFNLGCQQFRTNDDGTPTKIYHAAVVGHYQLACEHIKDWVFSGGKRLPGLVVRRQTEYERCMGLD